ncbi:MAG: LysE family transporter, partial [Candidatus Dormibacteraeota bacterium]|nr:LysE family transporter [Candidatus Dormibacteraeota bacterium]
MSSALPSVAAGLGLGLALAGAPGPVQAILLSESIRGGTARGFRAQAGANLTFGVFLVALALGVTILAPAPVVLRILKVAGGALLIWLAVDGFRTRNAPAQTPTEHQGLPPAVRGLLAVVLNPGTYLFLATAASSLLTTATRQGVAGAALLGAIALLVGVGMGDGTVVLLGGAGVRRAGARATLWARSMLAALL